MNGKPLTKDHGAPIRLIVPGWYGCACIKWVNEITLVDDGAEATSQMQEFAGSTQEVGVPKLVRDYPFFDARWHGRLLDSGRLI